MIKKFDYLNLQYKFKIPFLTVFLLRINLVSNLVSSIINI